MGDQRARLAVAIALLSSAAFLGSVPLALFVPDAPTSAPWRALGPAGQLHRVGGEVDLDAVRAELLDAVGQTVQPVHASVWLRRTT